MDMVGQNRVVLCGVAIVRLSTQPLTRALFGTRSGRGNNMFLEGVLQSGAQMAADLEMLPVPTKWHLGKAQSWATLSLGK